MLDIAGAANDTGFSVDERKEKAQRNSETYAETYGSPKIDLVSWFSREKYDCENPAVIAEVKNQIACTKLINCSTHGFANLSEVEAAGPVVIKSRIEVFRERETANATKRMTNPTDAELRWSARLVFNVASDQENVLTSFPGMFRNIKSVATDFNPNISRYSCRMEFQYNPAVVIPIWRMKYRLDAVRDQNATFLATEYFKKDPNSDYLAGLTEAALRANGVYERAQRTTASVATFTVQPSNKAPFVVDVTDTSLPGE
ncbi:MAG: hypothetical protein G4V63_12995 [Candidatus Afipia apatlaquensis]|uniref:Uncharacterized protein n=1 Tax=Candidatus Afipia apatlaquensis TaxID=2712852 RepID=A0A7C9RG16_9BRAD|nr:hypothetical protein [Candidatus Afipia apatlaquensis]